MDFDVGQVRSLTKKLHQSLGVDDRKVVAMKQVAGKIRNGSILLNDPSRFFLREGDLIKRHQLAGRTSTYRFFLFSDGEYILVILDFAVGIATSLNLNLHFSAGLRTQVDSIGRL